MSEIVFSTERLVVRRWRDSDLSAVLAVYGDADFLRSQWGLGMASEVVPAMLAHGASHHRLSRIIATVAAENHASQRVLLKSGMQLERCREEGDGSVTQVYAWVAPKVG